MSDDARCMFRLIRRCNAAVIVLSYDTGSQRRGYRAISTC